MQSVNHLQAYLSEISSLIMRALEWCVPDRMILQKFVIPLAWSIVSFLVEATVHTNISHNCM